MWTRQVIPGLLAGLLAGAFLLDSHGLGGFQMALRYLFKELEVPANLRLILFLYLFGSFVGLLRISGGVSGFARWLEPRVHSRRGAFAITWLSSALTFMAPDFRIITVAPVMRSLLRPFGIQSSEMSYAINVTATPLISLIPLGTAFVGYMVGLLATTLKHVGVSEPAYPLFLRSLPFNFFALAILAVGLYKSFFARESRTNDLSREQATTNRDELPPDPLEVLSERAKPVALHLIAPIALLVSLTLLLTWWSGRALGGTWFSALIRADAAQAMLLAIFVTLLAMSIFYAFREVTLSRIVYGIMAGGNEMMGVIVLLTLVWAVSGISTDLGFTTFVSGSIGNAVPRLFIVPFIFVLGSLLAYFIGSSFGAWGILMPLGFTLAEAAHVSLPLITGAVFASGTLGGFASPLSDNTVAMSTVMKEPVTTFARRLLPSTLLAGGAATVGYTIAGLVL